MTTEEFLTIKEQVHSQLDVAAYNATSVRNETNCYSYAIGATYPNIKCYRIGAISQLKPIDKPYLCVNEIIKLFKADLEALELKYEELTQFSKFELKENEYVLKLYVHVLPDDTIFDFHFIKFDESGGKWTEKRKGEYPSVLYNPNIYDAHWLWKQILFLKITK